MIKLMQRMLGVPSSEIEILSGQLVAAKIARAEHAAAREYHEAMERMLLSRVMRLQSEVKSQMQKRGDEKMVDASDRDAI